MEYDYVVVGAGLFGASFARRMTDAGKRCLVIERRNHIAGNAYTQQIAGIDVHMYGAHVFHTSNERVWSFVNRFSSFYPYQHTVLANYRGERYNLPFNMNTFHQMWGVETAEQAREKIAAQQIFPLDMEPRNLEEQAIRLVGTELYEKLILGYTQKQWGRPCSELPAFIIRRLPVRFTYDNRYFSDRFQGVPMEGYTALVCRMLEGIDLQLNTNYLANRQSVRALAEKVVFSGPIDTYFDYALGHLAYRSLRFETVLLEETDHQGCAVINHTDAEVPYTRVIEHKHFIGGNQPQTVFTREFAMEWTPGEEPFYPVNDEQNQALFARYRALAESEHNVLFGGRLGEYRYYDMDAVILSALEAADREERQ